MKENKMEIVINDDDIKSLKTDWENLPPTLYSLFEVLKTDSGEGPLIYLDSFSGPCGANLLTRFAHTDKNINTLMNEIIAREQELTPDAVLAEIVHFPSVRAGNVLMRPHIRDYEILYLSTSDLPENRIIRMSDLFLSVRNGKLLLRSKKLNRIIIPRLTNAHNYRHETNPVYHFLCAIQRQSDERRNLTFSWGYLNEELNFLPRVRYQKTILSLATWKINTAHIKYLFAIDDDDRLIDEVTQWRGQNELPAKMVLSDGDNELLIDWEVSKSIRSLFHIIKKRKMIWLKEFIFDPENSFVKDRVDNHYRNECIVAFYKNEPNETYSENFYTRK